MASDIEICNLALTRIGVTQPIASFTERSKSAELCAVLFSSMRDQVLRDFDWPFAESAIALADIGTPANGWLYRYRYPANCLKVREIVQPGQRAALSSESRIPFKIGYAPGGQVIHTDQPEAWVLFTFAVTDSGFFDSLFVNALTWKLAAELSVAIASKVDYRQMCEQQYNFALGDAQSAAYNEAQDTPEPESEFVSVRQ